MQGETYNLSHEKSVISTMLFNPENAFETISLMNENYFYHPINKAIYNAIKELIAKNMPIDEEFIKKVQGKEFNEQAMLDIMTMNPISNIEPYITELKVLTQRRSLIQLGIELQKNAIEPAEAIVKVVQSAENISAMDTTSAYDIRCLVDVADEKQEFILEKWLPLPRGNVSLLAAKGGTGKSWTSIQAALRFAIDNPNKQVLLWLTEDAETTTKDRCMAITKELFNVSFTSLRNIKINYSTPPQMIHKKEFQISEFYKMRRALRGYDFLVLDPLIAFYGGEENDNSQARKFMQPFMNWCKEDNLSILFLHHNNKDGGTRGASAFLDSCRVVYGMDNIYKNERLQELDLNETHMREFTVVKDNLGVKTLLDNNYKFNRHITPKATARELVIVYQSTKVEMPHL